MVSRQASRCFRFTKGAINWFFENEESGIILEDDSMPCTAFFDFSAKMLYKYRSNQKVWMIGGSNYAENFNPNNESYHFSKNFLLTDGPLGEIDGKRFLGKILML